MFSDNGGPSAASQLHEAYARIRQLEAKLEAIAARPAAPQVGEAPLTRYGVTWEGGKDEPLLTPMPDGYWTPWHLAVGEAERLREALAGLLALEDERRKAQGLRDCTCMNWSHATERAYEAGRCPHQIARAALASPAPQPARRLDPRPCLTRTCDKVEHGPQGGYLHAAEDDTPYAVDGVRYCGRCHMVMDTPPPRLRGGGIISHAEIEDARKAQE